MSTGLGKVMQGLGEIATTGWQSACELNTAVVTTVAALSQWVFRGLSAGYEASSSFLATNWPIVKDGTVHIGSNYGLHIAVGVAGVAVAYGIYKVWQGPVRT